MTEPTPEEPKQSEGPSSPGGPTPNYNPDLRMILVIILLVGLGIVAAIVYQGVFGD